MNQLLDKLLKKFLARRGSINCDRGSWLSLTLTDLLGPLYDLEAFEQLVLLAKELLHQVLDAGDGDLADWQPGYLGDDVRYPPGTLQDHARCPVQHGIVYRLGETQTVRADGEIRAGRGQDDWRLTFSVPGPPSNTTHTAGMVTPLPGGQTNR